MEGYNEHTLELMRKADFALADLASGGLLNPGQAKKFIRQLVEEAVFMKLATVRPMASYTDNIDKIGITGRVLRPAGAGTALSVADRVKPTTSQTSVVAKSMKAEIRLNDDTLEDNIEQKSLTATVQALMAEAVAKDMDDLWINGDTASADALLALTDGLLKLVSSHVHDVASAAVDATDFEEGRKLLPIKYGKLYPKMRWLCSVNTEVGFRTDLTTRATPLGDMLLFENKPLTPQGLPMIPVPVFPETLSPGHNTKIILMDPKNGIVGIWRNIKIEMYRDPSAGETIFVYSLRAGFGIEEEDATVKLNNITIV